LKESYGQGELFGVPELKSRTDEYLALVKKAGSEYVSGEIAADTSNKLNELLYPKDIFEEMADASWGIKKTSGEKEDRSLTFTRQMAALYNKDNFDGKVRVLEICYTDIDKTYQVLLDGDGSKVITDGSLKVTTRIDTPWDVWGSISRGEIRGDEALAKGLYKVNGDFSLMISWDKFFVSRVENTRENIEKGHRKKKKPVMLTMLIPWIAFWVSVSINATIGAMITMLICLAIPLLMAKRKMIIYDKLSIFLVGILSVFAMQNGMDIFFI